MPRLSRIEYAEDLGHHMHTMQVNKPALHEHEENLYEIIPDSLQNSGGHVLASGGGVNGVDHSNGVDHRTSGMGPSTNHVTSTVGPGADHVTSTVNPGTDHVTSNMVPGTTEFREELDVMRNSLMSNIILNHMHVSVIAMICQYISGVISWLITFGRADILLHSLFWDQFYKICTHYFPRTPVMNM